MPILNLIAAFLMKEQLADYAAGPGEVGGEAFLFLEEKERPFNLSN